MKKIEILKKAVSMIVSVGTAKIVKGIVESNVTVDTITDKVTVAAASFAIGGAVGELTSEYTSDMIDEIAAFYQTITNRKNSTKEN